jgi:hypothetical protein
MTADFETWAMRGAIVGLMVIVGTMAGLLKRAQDSRIEHLESAQGKDKLEFEKNIKTLIDNFAEENRQTRVEFSRAITTMADKIMELAGFFAKMELTMQNHFTILHDYQKEIRRDVRDVGTILYGRRSGNAPTGGS